MQSTTSLSTRPSIRFGLRMQLMVALGFLVILTVGVAGAAIWGLTTIHTSARRRSRWTGA